MHSLKSYTRNHHKPSYTRSVSHKFHSECTLIKLHSRAKDFEWGFVLHCSSHLCKTIPIQSAFVPFREVLFRLFLPLCTSLGPFLIMIWSPSSLLHKILGEGLPVAWHTRVLLSPSCAVTSPDVSLSDMSGGTRTKRKYNKWFEQITSAKVIFII
jgi:hypothetical protein